MGLSNAEWQVMRILWMKGSLTSSEIIAYLSERYDWSPSTVKTLLRRLVEKGGLTQEKSGRAFLYSPAISQKDSTRLVGQDVLDRVCAKSVSQVLANIIQQADLTQADVAIVEEALKAKREHLVEKVACNCLGPRPELTKEEVSNA
ncbi:CopY/TcrY family copper transport repressor [Streptococcus sp. DD12]|uniref:CopY/TcrY family copper transport repressor n=1 Tax=Streptococcus sp. DD12 TaxID=1777880 RepID=UPI000792F664|nr:CopY/TcrY family copper transport repressor [Streptococcus sp. DD12]KXT76996.1 Negative transcriptional regulator-copper transport operon [Streptococcus sp. DD12]